MAKEEYRFENGSLYVYDDDSNCYIHCYKNARNKTKKSAVAAYERDLNMMDDMGEEYEY